MRHWTLLIVLILLAESAAARDIHVSNIAGDDRFTGDFVAQESPYGGPVRTIAKALRLAEPEDRIVLANTGKPYRESVSLVGERHSGTSIEPFILDGNGATLEGADRVPHAAWEHVSGDVFRFAPERLGYQQLFLRGRPALQRHLVSADWTLPKLEPLEWCLTRGHVYFRVASGRTPQSYQPSCAERQTGITLYKVHDVVVRNLTVQGFQLDGVNAHDGAFRVKLESVTARGNGRSGISVGGASRVGVDLCLSGDNGQAQLRTEGFSETIVDDTHLLDNTAPPTVVTGGLLWIDGELVSDPSARTPGKNTGG